jgi:hypothetical protein
MNSEQDLISSLCKWVPVTTALRILRLRMEVRPPIWRVAANILNKQSRTADKGWSSSLGVGRGLTTPRRINVLCCETFKFLTAAMNLRVL